MNSNINGSIHGESPTGMNEFPHVGSAVRTDSAGDKMVVTRLSKSRRKGLSLVEVMISTTISAILLAAAGSAYIVLGQRDRDQRPVLHRGAGGEGQHRADDVGLPTGQRADGHVHERATDDGGWTQPHLPIQRRPAATADGGERRGRNPDLYPRAKCHGGDHHGGPRQQLERAARDDLPDRSREWQSNPAHRRGRSEGQCDIQLSRGQHYFTGVATKS